MKNQKILWLMFFIFLFPAIASGAILFQEGFEDTNFTSRGWYDSTNLQLSTTEHINGSTASVEYRFLQGATTPTSGGAIRRLFTPTNEVYVSYWVKYSSNWQGSNRSYHPHEFFIMTNENSSYWGPSSSHLTAYIEQNEGMPILAIQDSQNIDTVNINVDLTGVTENRAAAGCNGASPNEGYNHLSCYNVGEWRNAKEWKLSQVYFQDTPGQYYKSDWHHIEAYFKLNSISGGIGQSDGIVQYWYDGTLLIDHTNVILRTGQYPNMMFNQFLIAPWIGDGSPIEQTMWVDNLIVATDRASVGGNNASPTVTLSANTTSGNTPLSVSFTAAAADSDGTITQYEWDLDGNGVYEATNTYSTRAYTYNSAGIYNARVRVTDNGGANAISAVTITVASATGGDNAPPPASNSSGSSDSGGGSGGGCGFIKGKRLKANGEGLSFAIMLIIILGGITMIRKLSINYVYNQFKIIKRYFIKHTITLFLIGAVLGFFPALSHAATYYVSPTGSAAWASCTNINTPCSWQTAMANAVADDIVYFRGGTYNVGTIGSQRDYANMRPTNSGTSGHPITFIAYPGEVPNITGTVNSSSTAAYFGCSYVDYITWDGFAATMQIYTNTETQTWGSWGSDYCILRNSNFTGVHQPYYNNTSLVRIEGSNYNLIENNYFHDLTAIIGVSVNTAAVYLFDSNYTTVRNNTMENAYGGVFTKMATSYADIYNNFIYNATNSGFTGIQTASTAAGQNNGITVHNNIIIGYSVGIRVSPSVTVNTYFIYNNTIYSSTNSFEGIYLGGALTGAEVFNNIIANLSPSLRYYDGVVSYSNYNNFYRAAGNVWNRNYATDYTTLSSWTAATGFDANSITSNPLLVNAGGANPADYKLQASSPARTSGRGGSYTTVMGAYITGNEIIGYTSDPTLQFSSAIYEVSESTATATITVTRSGSSTGAVSVNYATSNGTATAGSDYTSASGTLNWADNDTASKTFTVSITNDTAIENDETINLALSNPTNGAVIGSVSTATLTILDNDGPPILRFENSAYSAGEGAGTATIRVRRTGGSIGAVSVNYATSNGTATAGSDYTAASGVLNWADGDTATKSFTVSITNDNAVESSETVNIALSNPTNGAQLGTPNSVVLTITDNDSNTTTTTLGKDTGSNEISGGGCGYLKDTNGKGPRAKGQGLTFAMMLILALAGIAIAKRFSKRFSYNL